MKKGFWLKLSGILLVGVLFLSFFLSWFFSVSQSDRLNRQHQLYLSEHFSFLYNHIQSYLKKTEKPSFSHLQKIISLYSERKRDRSFLKRKAPDSSQKSVFVINDSGLVMAHSEPKYKAKTLPLLSPTLFFVHQYPKGWSLIVEQSGDHPLITIARPVSFSSEKYFVVAHRTAQRPISLFWIYFKWVLLFGVLFFVFLFSVIFLYLRSFTQAAHFLFRLFGSQSGFSELKKVSSHANIRFHSFAGISKIKALSSLAHTDNFYLKNIRSNLAALLQTSHRKEKGGGASLPISSFSDIVNRVIYRSRRLYPDLRIHQELISDISLPVFSEQLFQSIWELVKNGAQAVPDGQSGDLMIRAFKKDGKWFCCEVEDKGMGMDRTEMEKAGELYFTTKKHSTGLGLPFVQTVLSRMGGIMKLQSAKEGGLKVSLFIPLDYITHINSLADLNGGSSLNNNDDGYPDNRAEGSLSNEGVSR